MAQDFDAPSGPGCNNTRDWLSSRWGSADADGLSRLFVSAYDELRGLAAAQLRHERKGHTLQVTALINEAYVRLSEKGPLPRTRSEFIRLAGLAMRHLLVDHARRRNAAKRGGKAAQSALDDAVHWSDEKPEQVLAVHEAIEKLERNDKRKAEIAQLRYFAGLTIDETAEALQISRATVKREWQFARALLALDLSDSQAQ